METSIVDDLVGAVERHQVATLTYWYDPAGGRRTFHPHVVFDRRDGRRCVAGVQVAGPTAGALPGWRTFEVNSISDLTILKATFQPDPAFKPNDIDAYFHVLAHV
jgi:hypothetical protein